MYTSSEKQPPEVVCKKDVLKNFESFTEKHLCWSFFLTKLQAWRPATLFKKTPTQMFLRNFLKVLKVIKMTILKYLEPPIVVEQF